MRASVFRRRGQDGGVNEPDLSVPAGPETGWTARGMLVPRLAVRSCGATRPAGSRPTSEAAAANSVACCRVPGSRSSRTFAVAFYGAPQGEQLGASRRLARGGGSPLERVSAATRRSRARLPVRAHLAIATASWRRGLHACKSRCGDRHLPARRAQGRRWLCRHTARARRLPQRVRARARAARADVGRADPDGTRPDAVPGNVMARGTADESTSSRTTWRFVIDHSLPEKLFVVHSHQRGDANKIAWERAQACR